MTSASPSPDSAADSPALAPARDGPSTIGRSSAPAATVAAMPPARTSSDDDRHDLIHSLGLPAFLRWWWLLALGGGITLGIIQLLFIRYVPDPFLSRNLMLQIAGAGAWLVLLVLWLGLVTWTFVVAPVKSARDLTPGYRVPPAWHLNTLQWIVSAPAFILAVFGIYDTFERTIDHYLKSGVIMMFKVPDWVWVYPPLLIGAMVYAWWMHGWLRQRMLRSTRVRGVCFDCGYDLRSQAELMLEERVLEDLSPAARASMPPLPVRCPECGLVTELPVSAVAFETAARIARFDDLENEPTTTLPQGEGVSSATPSSTI